MNHKATILAIDDSEVQLLVLKKTLGSYNCVTEKNPELVIQKIEEIMPDLLILDLNMPGISGIEIAEKVKQHPRFGNIPIMFLSSESDVSQVIACLKTGAFDFVRKPFIPEELLARVSTQIQLSAMHKALTEKREIEAVRKLMVSINHIFNNKLTIILANLEFLRESIPNADSLRILQKIQDACDVQMKVIARLNTLQDADSERYSDTVEMIKVNLEGMQNL